jgi:hypothetical protein
MGQGAPSQSSDTRLTFKDQLPPQTLSWRARQYSPMLDGGQGEKTACSTRYCFTPRTNEPHTMRSASTDTPSIAHGRAGARRPAHDNSDAKLGRPDIPCPAKLGLPPALEKPGPPPNSLHMPELPPASRVPTGSSRTATSRTHTQPWSVSDGLAPPCLISSQAVTGALTTTLRKENK